MQKPSTQAMAGNRNFWRGQTIRLRPIEQHDLDEILTTTEEYDTELDRYEDAIVFPQSRERDREELQNLAKQVGQDDFLLCFIEDLQGQKVGHINSFDCVRRNGTFKYALAIKQPFWRKGYGREAVLILLRYFFRELRYQKCTALVYSFNERSIRFHEALGFRFEGRLRNMVYTDGQFFDEIYFGLTSAEWDAIDPPLGLQGFNARDEPVRYDILKESQNQQCYANCSIARVRPSSPTYHGTSPLRVLQIIYNPVIEDEGGRRLTEVLRWNDPDRLAAGYSTDLTDASHGIARFEIVDRVELDEWPVKQDGFRYDDRTFLQAWRDRSGFHQPDGGGLSARSSSALPSSSASPQTRSTRSGSSAHPIAGSGKARWPVPALSGATHQR